MMHEPAALLFDVQGTATDFHSVVCGEAERLGGGRHRGVDWAAFTRRWREGYFAALSGSGGGDWVPVHAVYRRALDTVLAEYGIADLSGAERDRLTMAWQRQQPWPDVVGGLTRLKQRFTLATLSNADVCTVVNISKRTGLSWDAIFAAEMCGAFKPDPAVYRMAARYLGLAPADIMMVASHKYDIRAAGALGFQTAFVARPLEFGVGGTVDVAFADEFDLNASDFADLADQLGC
jgi:2-haloacid dehalogenase